MATDFLQAMGVGAGFDTKNIVTALVTAEKASKQDLRSIDQGNLLNQILRAFNGTNYRTNPSAWGSCT